MDSITSSSPLCTIRWSVKSQIHFVKSCKSFWWLFCQVVTFAIYAYFSLSLLAEQVSHFLSQITFTFCLSYSYWIPEKKLYNQCDDGCLHIWAFQHLVFKSSAPGTFSPSLPLSAGLTFDVWFIGKKNHLCLWLITHIPQNFRGRTLTIGFRVKAQLHKIINTIKVGSETQNLVVQLILACCLWKHFANKAMSALLYHNGN